MKKINIIVFVVFLLLALLIGNNHEPWVDEAQSWLIARDASAFEIIWDISRYEGSFPLWQLTLKLFINLGLNYEYLFIVPTIISAIGLIVFLKKVEAPKYVKILLPFTFFIFYQYTIVARNYCYLLLAFSILAITYKKRTNEPLKYILALIFMSFISLHGMIISLVLVTTFLIEIIKEKKIKKCIKYIVIYGIIMLLEIIILFPRADIYVSVSTALYSIKEIIYFTVNMLLGNGNLLFKIYNIIAIILFLIFAVNLIFVKNKDFCLATIIMLGFMFVIRFASHHVGIIYLLVIFGIICNYEEIKAKNKHVDKIFIVILILYTVYSFQTSVNDYLYEYSGAKEMANYINENRYNKEEIFGFGYKPVSVQAYFEENLYKNREETIYKWSINNKDYYNYCNFPILDKSQFKEKPKFILIECDSISDGKLDFVKQAIEDSGKYEIEYQTSGRIFFKNSYSENEGYTLYKLKE